MSSRTGKIISKILIALLALIFLGSATSKIIGSGQASKMASDFGLSLTAFRVLGVIEALAIILFVFSRTGILGTIFLVAYMGGGIATHLEHGQPIIAPIIIELIICATAAFRYPELTFRFFKRDIRAF